MSFLHNPPISWRDNSIQALPQQKTMSCAGLLCLVNLNATSCYNGPSYYDKSVGITQTWWFSRATEFKHIYGIRSWPSIPLLYWLQYHIIGLYQVRLYQGYSNQMVCQGNRVQAPQTLSQSPCTLHNTNCHERDRQTVTVAPETQWEFLQVI